VTAPRSLLDRTFVVTLALKGLDGVIELLAGLALLLVTPAQLDAAAHALTRHELREDPHDPLAHWLLGYTGNLSVSATLFGAVYLLLHGAVKVVLVVAVLRDRLWAYPWLIGFLIAFIGWQGVELVRHPTWGLAALTAFDILIVVLTVREYRLHRARRNGEVDVRHVPRPRRSRPRWVIGDSAGGTAVALVFFVVAALMAAVAAVVASPWAWLLVLVAAVAIVDAVASIVYHRRRVPGFEPDGV
jgi:uncharacterized membrane protein